MTTPNTKLTQRIAREFLLILEARLVRRKDLDGYQVYFRDDEFPYWADTLDEVTDLAYCYAGGHEYFDEAESYLALMTMEGGQ